jgi:dTDP-4-amino-4,6-dideoxygalactose transaminase
MQAAVLSVLLPHLDGWNTRRREIACAYSAGIRNTRVHCPRLSDTSSESYVAHLYVVRADNREQLKSHLSTEGIPFDVHYPIPDHCQQSLQGHLTPVALPATERLCSEVITLPCFPEMTEFEVGLVIDCMNRG